jgi:hypothetical protein
MIFCVLVYEFGLLAILLSAFDCLSGIYCVISFNSFQNNTSLIAKDKYYSIIEQYFDGFLIFEK